jgi:hypothetical protein
MRLRELLREIVGADPYPFEWLDKNRCVFNTTKTSIGIFVDFFELEIASRTLEIANISFGTFHEVFITTEDLDTQLTNTGEPRTVFSTVAHACIANKEIVESDLLCLAASDEHRQRRSILYSLALAEIQSNTQKFKHHNRFKIETLNGSIISILSNHHFSDEEKDEIRDKLKIEKLI